MHELRFFCPPVGPIQVMPSRHPQGEMGACTGEPPPLAWLEALGMPVLLCDGDGRVTWVSAAFRAVTGLSACQAQACADLPEGDARIPCPDGREWPCRVQHRAMPGGHRLVVLEERMAAAAPVPEAAHLGRLLDLARGVGRVGVWERDLPSLKGRWSLEIFELFGIAPADQAPPLEMVFATVPPEDGMRERLMSSLTVPGRYSHRFRVRQPGGDWRRIRADWDVLADADGRPVRLVGLMTDDTEAWQLAQSVEEATQRLQLAIELAGIGIWRHDFASARFHYSPQTYAMLQLEPQDNGLSLETVRSLIHHDDLAEVLASAERALASGQPTDMQARYRRGDGQWRHILTRRVVQRDGAGQPVGFVGVALDVTDTQDARRVREEARLLQRESRAKSEFLARVSHELRTPLNAVLGFAQLMRAEGPDASPALQKRRLDHIRAAGEHLLALINDVLDLTCLESGGGMPALQPVPLQAALNEAVALVEHDAQAHGVSLEVQDVHGSVLADPTRLRQVLLNLLTNGIKYNRASGHVVLGARHGADGVTIQVQDDGPGLDAMQRHYAFEPFNRLGAEGRGIEGTGIGLSIVRTLVERMHGEVSVHSEPGQGTRFDVRLREAVPAPPAAGGEPPSDAPPQTHEGGEYRLLYIEDNPVNVLIVSELASRLPGVHFASAGDGRSGVALAQVLQPDMVLVDMHLPDIDGFEVLRRLRQQPALQRVPCIALSANALPDVIARARAAGFDDYWTKPLDFQAFENGVRVHFWRRQKCTLTPFS